MAYFKRSLRQEQSKIYLGEGINTYIEDTDIKRSECLSNKNISSHKIPYLTTRKGRKKFCDKISGPNGIGSYYDTTAGTFRLHLLDAAVWKYWNGSSYTLIGTISNEPSSFIQFNTSSYNYFICINGTSVNYWYGALISTALDAPKTTLYCVDDRRLYALKDNSIYFSAGGSITDWTTANDAGKIEVNGSKGIPRAITSYQDTVIAFFDETMHILYGNDVFDYQLGNPINIGCVNQKATIELNGILYFVYKDGIYRFSGGLPEKISDKVNSYFENFDQDYLFYSSIGKYKEYIYISMYDNSNRYTLEYNTKLNVWNVHDAVYYGFATLENELIGLGHYGDDEGKLWSINNHTRDGFDYETSETAIDSEWVSGWIDYNSISTKKKLTKQYYALYVPVDSSLVLYYSTDGTTWNSLKSFDTSSSVQIVKVSTVINEISNVTRFKLKFVGSGEWYIEKIDEYYRIKKRL